MLGRETAPGRVVSRPDLAPDLHMGVQDATAPFFWYIAYGGLVAVIFGAIWEGNLGE